MSTFSTTVLPVLQAIGVLFSASAAAATIWIYRHWKSTQDLERADLSSRAGERVASASQVAALKTSLGFKAEALEVREVRDDVRGLEKRHESLTEEFHRLSSAFQRMAGQFDAVRPTLERLPETMGEILRRLPKGA